MLEGFFERLLGAANVSPEYTASRCLAVKRSRDACTLCRDTCPHHAITIRREVEIDDVDCTGCGLCVQVCPSEALEPNLRIRPGLPLRCSQVAGDAQSIVCLGRLRPTDMLRLAGKQNDVRLARGNCHDCPVGTAAVLEAIAEVSDDAQQLAALHGRELRVQIEETDRFDETGLGRAVSRRDLLRGGFQNLQLGAADVLAPLDPGGEEDDSLPLEMQARFRTIEAAEPDEDTPVPWKLPRIADGCIMCPVCTQICPTNAFSRDFQPIDVDGAVLRLDPERCVGCDACVDACPVNVISMDSEISWGELSGGTQVAYHRRTGQAPKGSVAR